MASPVRRPSRQWSATNSSRTARRVTGGSLTSPAARAGPRCRGPDLERFSLLNDLDCSRLSTALFETRHALTLSRGRIRDVPTISGRAGNAFGVEEIMEVTRASRITGSRT